MTPQLPPESHYDPKKLDKLFAIGAIILLVSLLGLFAKDYSREWKTTQRQFRELEVEKTRVKMDAESNALAKNAEYQALLKNLSETKLSQHENMSTTTAIQRQIEAAQAIKNLHTKLSQDAKAQYGALKYKYESALNHQGTQAGPLKNELDRLSRYIDELRVKVETDEQLINAKNEQLKIIEKTYRDLEKKRLAFVKKQEILLRKLKRIDQQEMTWLNQVAEFVRDLPLIDLANPNFKIQQIVLNDIPEDVNFMKVPRVDRCTTCHLGIDNPDFKNAPQPFKSHPNLELFMAKNSPHPLESFGCTSCHMGRGRGTDFTSAAHTPRNEEQAEQWAKKHRWQELHHWEQPMLPVTHTQAGCFKCHQDQEVIKGADKLNLGLALIERAGCYGCHAIDKYKAWPKTGPSLEHLASKTSREWAYHWIENPQAIRPNTWMPSYFNQTNNSDLASMKRGQQEILSLVHVLFANSKPLDTPTSTTTGDALKGKELVSSLGCLACHQIEPTKFTQGRSRDRLHREFGPNLIGMGSKTKKPWLIQWLKDPTHYNADTRMPNLRLTDQEAADIAEYLMQDKNGIINKPIPLVDEKVLDAIIMDFLTKSTSIHQATAQLKDLNRDGKLMLAGQRLIREYGCFACHNIPGYDNEKPIGTDLSEQGSKSVERLDFGFIHLEHSKQAWFKQKLLNPRAFDHARVLQPLEKLKMPNFNLSDDDALAMSTALLGFVKDRPNANKMANQGLRAAFINEGQKTVRQLNCQGCHLIEKEGASIQPTVTDWLATYQGKDATEAKNFTNSFSPPDLLIEGQKVQAQWLFEFLHDPLTIRPWLHVRMPTYKFHDGQINTLVKYFNYLDNQEFPFTDMYHAQQTKEEYEAGAKLFSKEVFSCAQCHVVGDHLPSGTQDTWAPDLALASKRLKPQWIIRWITNPPALLPGTKMPVFYDPMNFDTAGPPNILGGDSNRQIKALRDYLLTLSAQSQGTKNDVPKTGKTSEVPAAVPSTANTVAP